MKSTYVALLRGINVGGKNKLPMKDLAAMFSATGCDDVRTYIQSGNVIFSASLRVGAKVPGQITSQIEKRFGYRIPIVSRTAGEFAQVISDNPFLKSKTDEETLHVMFLADSPDSQSVAALDSRRSPPDEFIVHGREIYLHLPNGVARSKLTNSHFDAKLSTVSTMRNWKTILRIREMMKGTPFSVGTERMPPSAINIDVVAQNG